MLAAAVLSAIVVLAGCVAVAGAAPPGRGYELVSPVAKNGADVMAATSKTVAASAGGAVAFASLGGFGDVLGTSVDAQYVASRTGVAGTSGWRTHGITPASQAHTFAALASNNTSSFEAAFSPDLSRAVYRSWRPLTNATNTADLLNLYVTGGLLTGPETVSLATEADHPVSLPGFFPPDVQSGLKLALLQPSFAAASTDLSHVLFESAAGLTADAPAPFFPPFPQELYEYAGGAVRLVGRVPVAPDVECDDVNGPMCVPAPSSQAGVPANLSLYAGGMMSADGSRIFFQTPEGTGAGTVYVREDGTRTVQLWPGDARLWATSADGTRAFFTAGDLYMWDANAPSGSPPTLISSSETGDPYSVESVVGASADGHYVYFVASGQLVAGETARPAAGLYVWHDGQLAYIGAFFGLNEARRNTPRQEWSFPRNATTARVAPDGRHVLFMTTTDAGLVGRGGFTGYDQGSQCTFKGSAAGYRELYDYSADTGRLAGA